MKKHIIASTTIGALLTIGASATILTNPTISDASDSHGQTGNHTAGTYGSGNIFDGGSGNYSSNSNGVDTYIVYDFGSDVNFDTIIQINRPGNSTEQIGSYTLTYADMTTTSITRTSAANSGTIDHLGGVKTTSSVRMDVDTQGNGGTATNTNVGVTEAYFLRTPSDMTLLTTVSVIASSGAGAGSNVSKITDGIVAVNNTDVFISNNGNNTYVDFDLGSTMHIGGFDYFDMLSGWHNTSFDMIFSDDTVFDASDVKRSYSGSGSSASTQSDEFTAANINARYVRFDVTSGQSWAGINEMRFYSVNQVPEPSAAALLGLGGLAFIFRRHRA